MATVPSCNRLYYSTCMTITKNVQSHINCYQVDIPVVIVMMKNNVKLDSDVLTVNVPVRLMNIGMEPLVFTVCEDHEYRQYVLSVKDHWIQTSGYFFYHIIVPSIAIFLHRSIQNKKPCI